MKHLYPFFKTVLTASFLLSISQLRAQSPTTVTQGHACTVVQDFNTTSGGFTAPSIYRDDSYSFNWTGADPNGQFVSSPAPTVAPYEASIISPVYPNTALDGTVDIGFSFTAPAGTLYRLRVIRPNVALGTADILAITSEGPPTNSDGSPNWTALPGTSGTICLRLLDNDVHPGQNLRYEFVFYVPTLAAPVTFDNFALNANAPAPLPVTFLGIVANREKNTVNLKWDVASEENVREYQVEKSLDGSSFSKTGSVTAQKRPVYSFADLSANGGTLYYRLKSVDIDGRAKYSPIVKLVNNDSYSNVLRAYPSPARTQVTLQHKKLNANTKLSVCTMDGRVVKVMTPANGASNTVVDISTLSPGMYVLRLENANGKIETASFIKQ
ncbi:MAG TPA: T9SS type A sorting domain-containing protein [Flavisolibacter sp.]|nr:T9SS type A sorting domain-containing protein [Flavisolibacter sp.]